MNSLTTEPMVKTSQDGWGWTAWDDRTYDGYGCPLGVGRTEQEAVQDLLEQIRDKADE